jgi:hypothetical protein
MSILRKIEAVSVTEDGKERRFIEGDFISVDFVDERTRENAHAEGILARCDARGELRVDTRDTPPISVPVPFRSIVKVY